jgi:hypothetical protein
MQIGSSTPLTFIGGSTPPMAGRSEDNAEAAANEVANASPSVLALPGTAAEQTSPGVILSLQSEQAASDRYGKDLVYSDTRKSAASQEGVLLAMPVSPAELKSQAFVHHAVAAMRAYADEQDRSKALGRAAGTDAAALVPRGLAEVQKLAAHFKLFG